MANAVLLGSVIGGIYQLIFAVDKITQILIDTNIILGKTSIEKKRFLSGIARMMGRGGLPMPEFFGPLFRSVFLVN